MDKAKKNPAAVALGRLSMKKLKAKLTEKQISDRAAAAGKKGQAVLGEKYSEAEISELRRKAARVRWTKK